MVYIGTSTITDVIPQQFSLLIKNTLIRIPLVQPPKGGEGGDRRMYRSSISFLAIVAVLCRIYLTHL